MAARVIEWNELRPGMEVWEDWLYGTGTFCTKVVSRGTVEGQFRFQRLNGVSYLARDSREYRFWDTEPTMEEREFTAW